MAKDKKSKKKAAVEETPFDKLPKKVRKLISFLCSSRDLSILESASYGDEAVLKDRYPKAVEKAISMAEGIAKDLGGPTDEE